MNVSGWAMYTTFLAAFAMGAAYGLTISGDLHWFIPFLWGFAAGIGFLSCIAVISLRLKNAGPVRRDNNP